MTVGKALELAQHDITVNAYAPGPIDTPMSMFHTTLKAHWPLTEVVRQFYEDVDQQTKERLMLNIPVGRFGKPEDIASYVSWLTSEDSGFVTGMWDTLTYIHS